MKKMTVWSIVMMILSAMGVSVAINPTAITVYYPGTKEYGNYSFFQQVPEAPVAMCLLFAGIFSAVSLVLAAVLLVTKKKVFLKWILGINFAAMSLAVLPICVRPDPMVLPNMLHPLSACVLCVVSYVLLVKLKTGKMKMDAVEKESPRLPDRHL